VLLLVNLVGIDPGIRDTPLLTFPGKLVAPAKLATALAANRIQYSFDVRSACLAFSLELKKVQSPLYSKGTDEQLFHASTRLTRRVLF
jgi:hypothetical protein